MPTRQTCMSANAKVFSSIRCVTCVQRLLTWECELHSRWQWPDSTNASSKVLHTSLGTQDLARTDLGQEGQDGELCGRYCIILQTAQLTTVATLIKAISKPINFSKIQFMYRFCHALDTCQHIKNKRKFLSLLKGGLVLLPLQTSWRTICLYSSREMLVQNSTRNSPLLSTESH